MFLQKLWFMVVTSTLLLQRCIADESLSVLQTSSSTTSYSNAESQNSNIEISPDSFSKSDSSFSSSQSEVSQNDSSVINAGNEISIQDSSYHSLNTEASNSDSNIVVSDGSISQTESNFAASSSSTAESDSSLTMTPNSTVESSTKSLSTSTTSSSSTTSRSIDGQFLEDSADISFPNDISHISSPYQTKSLNSIPDFPLDSLDSKPFPEFPTNPKISPNLTNNSLKKSGSKVPYSPTGIFNSKSQKIPRPVETVGINPFFIPKPDDDLAINSSHVTESFPSNSNSISTSPILPSDSLPNNLLQNDSPEPQSLNFDTPTTFTDSVLNSPTDILDDTELKPSNNFDVSTSQELNDLPIVPHYLDRDHSISDDISSPDHSSVIINSSPLDDSLNIHQSENIDISSVSQSENIKINENSLDDSSPNVSEFLDDNSVLDEISSPNHSPTIIDSSPIDATPNIHQFESIDTTSISPSANMGVNENPSNDSILDHDISPVSTNPLHNDEILKSSLQPPHPIDHSIDFPENNIPIEEFSTSIPSKIPEFPESSSVGHSATPYDSLMHSEKDDIPIEYDSEDINTPITDHYDTNSPFAHLPSNQPYDLLKDSSTFGNVPTPKTPHDSLHPNDLTSDLYSNPTTLESMDTNQDGYISPEEISESNNPVPKTLDSTYSNQNDFISPEQILESNNPSLKSTHPYDLTSYQQPNPTSLESMDVNQDGFISPEEKFKSSYPTPQTLDSTYSDSNGHILPEEILESNNPVVESTISELDIAEHPKIPDSAYALQSGHDNSKNLPDNAEYFNPEKFSPHEQLPYVPEVLPLQHQSNEGNYYPQKPKFMPHNQPPTPLGPFNPKALPTYPRPGYPRPIYPLPLPYFSKHNSPFTKYPSYSPYFKNKFSNYPPLYGLPMMQSPYDYSGNFLKPSPLPHQPLIPNFYNPLHPFPLGNPFLNMPLHPYPGPSFNSAQRSHYIPENWSKSLPSKHSQVPQFLDSTSNLPSKPANLDSPSYNKASLDLPSYSSLTQMSNDLPLDQPSTLGQLPYDVPVSHTSLDQSPSLLESPNDVTESHTSLDQSPSLMESPNDVLPVLHKSLDQSPSLMESPYDLTVPHSPLDQQPLLMKSSYDSPVPQSSLYQPPLLMESSYEPVPQSSLDQQPLLMELPYDSPVPHSFLDQPSSLSESSHDLPIVDLPPDQPLTTSSSNIDSQLEVLNSLQPDSLDNDSSSAMPYNLPLTVPDPPSSSPLNFDKNLPLAKLVSPSNSPAYNNIDDEIFNILKQKYESTTNEYQLSNSIYPRDIAPDFDAMTDDQLTFNFVVLGSSPAALSTLKTLSDTGKSILLIERGSLPPHISKSLYFRSKILQSDYVRRIKSTAPHCNTNKILYAPNVLGEESTYDSNTWDYGLRSKYIKWGKLCPKWTWNNVIEYFTDDSNKPYTRAIPVTTEIDSTKAVNVVTSIFNDVGLYRTEYHKGKRLKGLTVVPHLQENGENVILAENIFRQLTSCTNIQLALETIPDSIIFDNVGKAIGVVVKTPCGSTKTITILDELIIGSNPIDTVQFLYQSGIGDHEKLQQLNIPTQINLPYVGKEVIITPLHFGVIYLFPQGTLLSDTESDFASMNYLFGKYGLPSALAVDYLKAALNIYEAHEANVVFNFKVFSKYMPERLNSYIERLTHIDGKIKDYLTNLCQEYDMLLAVPQLTNVLSRGEIMVDNSSGVFEVLVNTGMYKSKRDITIMQKALKVLKSLAETETFKSMNGKVVQIPIEQCGTPDFSTEYNQCSIRYLSLPNLHYCGGTIMGVSPLTSVVNEDLLVHGTTNVRICSASVVPYGTSTDSSAVSSAIGNLGAHIILQKYYQ